MYLGRVFLATDHAASELCQALKDGARDPLGLGLASLAVMPGHQRRGIGVRLVETALRRARLLGHAYVVVIGDLKYYSRFGFAPAAQFGLSCSGAAPTLDFLALELVFPTRS